MPDLEKVIKGLEHCGSADMCDNCPYLVKDVENEGDGCQMFADALTLLKAKEPVKPKKVKGYTPPVCTLFDYECENCESPIMEKQPFCAGCGKPVKGEL